MDLSFLDKFYINMYMIEAWDALGEDIIVLGMAIFCAAIGLYIFAKFLGCITKRGKP